MLKVRDTFDTDEAFINKDIEFFKAMGVQSFIFYSTNEIVKNNPIAMSYNKAY